jgi:hypothetical protein
MKAISISLKVEVVVMAQLPRCSEEKNTKEKMISMQKR